MVEEMYDFTPSLPDTAPVDPDYLSQSTNYSWGKLLPVGCKQSTKELVEKSYRVGRSPKCEVFIDQEHVNRDVFTLISKYHFRIARDIIDSTPVVYLEDLSSNGTFVNGERVGRDRRIVIGNTDEISLAKPSNKVYLYLDCTIVDSWLPESQRSRYQILKHLGNGGFAEVKLVIDKRSCRKYALKKVLKDRLEGERIYTEVKILQKLNHPFIIKLEDVVDTPEAILITLEYMSGGDLLRQITSKTKLREPEAKNIFYQLCLALEYLHGQGITHRDLKLENVLLNSETNLETVIVKVADFGLSKIIDSATELKTTCGTLKYVAPEVLSSNGMSGYTHMVDIWSLGVILFVCLSGHYPFHAKNSDKPVMIQILSGSYTMTQGWHLVSSAGINLVRRMLMVCPDKRIPLPDILNHRWLQDHNLTTRIENFVREYHETFTNENDNPLPPPQKKPRIDCNYS